MRHAHTDETTTKGADMNYIKKLESENADLKAEIATLEQKLQEIAEYLALEKFNVDTNVSKYDILRMLGRY